MAAEPSDLPDPPLYDEHGEPISIAFETEADYEAWLSRHPEQRVFCESGEDPHAESRRQLAEWRAAGNEGLPPGWIRARDYFRQRGV